MFVRRCEIIAYYSEQAGRIRYEEYLRLGYGIRCRLCGL
jgi:hypothetical protein